MKYSFAINLKELLGKTKKEFHEVIFDAIQGKRQVANEVIGVNAVKIPNDLDEEVTLLAKLRGEHRLP